ncbi:KTR4 (YBR199W) [Zygosaccharomyces parabailii]|nr:KTR4 (YBR199W) [Zygosaccharomyces parabailii]CDH09419.1 probable KTR4-Alpha-1,2-mannosyltransferase [Zygosaccharomyces bailii ISA1307]
MISCLSKRVVRWILVLGVVLALLICSHQLVSDYGYKEALGEMASRPYKWYTAGGSTPAQSSNGTAPATDLQSGTAPDAYNDILALLQTPLVDKKSLDEKVLDELLRERKQLYVDALKKPITEPKVAGLIRAGEKRTGSANAAILSLVRNEDLDDIIGSILELEEQFNGDFQYPYVFLNDGEFTSQFKDAILRALPQGRKVEFGTIDPELWDMPSDIDEQEFKERMEKLNGIQHADQVSYHNMCRFYSKAFYHHPLMQKYKYAWRVEPGVHFYCKINYDVFQFMQASDKIYGYVLNLYDSPESIETLWVKTLDFLKEHPSYLNEKGAHEWIRDNVQKPRNYDMTKGYSTCHFWTNFEITDMDFLRSTIYEEFMVFLDSQKGFYYERWGDAPVRSLALALFADKSRIHWFRDIAYTHFPYTNCPACPEDSTRCNGDCKPGLFVPWDNLEVENCQPTWIKYEMSQEDLDMY